MNLFESKEIIEKKAAYPRFFGKCLGREKDPYASKLHLHPQKGPIQEPNSPEILGVFKRHLPLTGVLEMDENGFIYLKLNDSIFHDLIPLLSKKSAKAPPYLSHGRRYGAHISVVLGKEENPSQLSPHILGQTFSFMPKECFYIEPENWPEMRYVWFITVDAPELSEIRRQMRLPPKIKEQEFHITLATESHFLNFEEVIKEPPEGMQLPPPIES